MKLPTNPKNLVKIVNVLPYKASNLKIAPLVTEILGLCTARNVAGKQTTQNFSPLAQCGSPSPTKLGMVIEEVQRAPMPEMSIFITVG